jgi:SAM-dependent methyltransferase
MVAAARRKAHAAGVEVAFRTGDMRDFALAAPIDAVISLGDTLNHLLTMEDLTRTLGCVARTLRPGGYFIFDVNTRRGLEDWDGETFAVDSGEFAYILDCSLNPLTGVLTARASFFLPAPAPPRFRRYQEEFRERAWPLELLQAALAQAGLTVLSTHGWQTMAPGSEVDRHVTVAARRRPT